MTHEVAIKWLKMQSSKPVKWDDYSEESREIREAAEQHMKEAFNMAIEALKAQEPHVMTLEEVRQLIYGSPYIIETNLPSDEPRLKWGLYSHNGIGGNYDFAITDGRHRLFDADYGKIWRCWTSRPTDEQREKEPWG